MLGHHQAESRSLRRRSFRAAGVLVLSVFSLLLWSRLKMVTDTPRMVYADPKRAEPAEVGPARGAETGSEEEAAGSAPAEDGAEDRAGSDTSDDR